MLILVVIITGATRMPLYLFQPSVSNISAYISTSSSEPEQSELLLDISFQLHMSTISTCLVEIACLAQKIIQLWMGSGPKFATVFRAQNRDA